MNESTTDNMISDEVLKATHRHWRVTFYTKSLRPDQVTVRIEVSLWAPDILTAINEARLYADPDWEITDVAS